MSYITRFWRVGAMGLAATAALLLVGPATSQDATLNKAVQLYVDDSPEAAELIEAARQRLTNDESAEAARLLQQSLDRHGRKLLDQGEGRYAEVRVMVNRMIASDERLLDMYRQLNEPAAAKRLSDAGRDGQRLSEVVERYGLTESGLAASLRLAGLRLEADEAKGAAAALEAMASHPSLSAHRAQWNRLRAFAALYAGDETTYKAVRAEIEAGGDDAAIRQLDELAAAIRRTASQPVFDPLDALPPAAMPKQMAEPLWSQNYPTGLGALVDNAQVDQQWVGEEPQRARLLGMLPVAQGAVVYASNGQTVYALDRSSGLELWRHKVDVLQNLQQQAMFLRRRPVLSGTDLNVVTPSEGRVLAVMGFASTLPSYTWYRTTTPSVLACLDASTGRSVWQKSPYDVSPELEEAYWYGRPIVARGRVYMLARLRSRTQFRNAYVAALNVRDGSTIWLRHIVSTEMPDRNTSPAVSELLLEGGWLYVDTQLGAVGRLSASDGSIDWLTVHAPPNRDYTTVRSAWQLTAPLLTEAGLIVADDWNEAVRVYDPQTGVVRRTLGSESLGRPQYLLRIGADLVTIGTQVAAYDGSTLERKWIGQGAGDTYGKAVAAGDRLYVPIREGIRVYDTTTGQTIDTLTMPTPANLLPLDGQFIVAREDGLHGYSGWQEASAELQQRIAAQGDTVLPHLSMAWLAYRSRQPVPLLESVDKSIHLLERDPNADRNMRRRLFTMLMTMATDGSRADAALRRQLFERLAATTTRPAEEVVYRLALGEFHESQQEPTTAVEHYQRILAQPQFARQLYSHEGGTRQAGLEAQRRIGQLIKQHGRAVYAKFDAYAAERARQLANEADPDALIELARAYPHSDSAATALRLAADRTAERGELASAIALLNRASQITEKPDEIAAIAGRQVELFERANQPDRARRVLRQLSTAHPTIKPLRDGKPIDVSQWLAELQVKGESTGRLPHLQPPLIDPAVVMHGQLMTPDLQDPVRRPTDRFLLKGLDQFEMRRTSDGGVIWRKRMNDAASELLAIEGKAMWLWYTFAQQVELLDSDTGNVVWNSGPIDKLLAAVRAAEAPAPEPDALVQDLLRRQRGGRRGPWIAAGEGELAVADEQGRVVVVSAEGGKVMWQTATPVRQATGLSIAGGYVLLTGHDAARVPLLCVYDVLTGRLLHQVIEPQQQPIIWAGLTEAGLVVYVTSSQVVGFDLATGQPAWTSQPGAALGDGPATLGDDRLVLSTADRDLIWLNLSDGHVMARRPLRHDPRGEATVQFTGDGWIAVTNESVSAFDPDGKPLWQDAISDVKQFDGPFAVSDRYVMVVNNATDELGRQRPVRRLYMLDRQGGAVQYERDLALGEPIDRLFLADDRLVVGSRTITAILRGSK